MIATLSDVSGPGRSLNADIYSLVIDPMCLLLFAYRCHPRYPLLLLANRDEFYDRPAEAAAPRDGGALVAGRDLRAGGTWAGMARGRVAAVTNLREPGRAEPDTPLSRGDIPRDFLRGALSPGPFAAGLAVARYRGFNALLFQLGAEEELVCAGSRHQPFAFAGGVHGISNGPPDAPWPKVEKGRAGLARLLEGLGGAESEVDEHNFVRPAMALLRDRVTAPVPELPDTGVGSELELALSPLFVRIDAFPGTPDGGYGTRASTLMAVDRNGTSQFWEQNYDRVGISGPLRHFTL